MTSAPRPDPLPLQVRARLEHARGIIARWDAAMAGCARMSAIAGCPGRYEADLIDAHTQDGQRLVDALAMVERITAQARALGITEVL